jgi:hypothetical protein
MVGENKQSRTSKDEMSCVKFSGLLKYFKDSFFRTARLEFVFYIG